MAAITNADDSNFATEVLDSDIPVIVDFWAEWCGPCRMVAPELEALAAERDDVKVVKVNVDAAQGTAANYRIQSIPTIGLFRDGELERTSIGAKPRAGIEADLGLGATV
ncbi:MAG: thioredoxin [Acidimicrobiia bacterium]|nr:thioredoxin [Acidimicrobiia bacterium]